MSETGQRIVLAARPQARAGTEHFRLETFPVASPGDGEILVRVIYLSVDPYMRGLLDAARSYRPPVAVGAVMQGGCVGQVLESRNPGFSEGDFVTGMFGWASHATHDGAGVRKLDPREAPLSTALGVLGMPGFTAYIGLLEIAGAQRGETLVVSAATGAVGSMAAQLGRLNGLHVIGVAGGAKKCAFATRELGLDACLDRRTANLGERLAEACPDGVDIYYENVGGDTLHAVLPLMNVGARIPVCGMIAWYDAGAPGQDHTEGPDRLPRVWRTILVQRLQVRGFIITDHYDRFGAFIEAVAAPVKSGRIRYHETIDSGLARAPQALLSLLHGDNLGKQLVQISTDPTR